MGNSATVLFMFNSVYYCIRCSKPVQRVFLDLNADIGYTHIVSRKKLTLCGRSDFQPISGSESYFNAVNYRFAFARNNTIDFFIVLVGVYKWDTCAGGKLIDADLCTGQCQFIVKFNTTFISNVAFRVICHDNSLQNVFARLLAYL